MSEQSSLLAWAHTAVSHDASFDTPEEVMHMVRLLAQAVISDQEAKELGPIEGEISSGGGK